MKVWSKLHLNILMILVLFIIIFAQESGILLHDYFHVIVSNIKFVVMTTCIFTFGGLFITLNLGGGLIPRIAFVNEYVSNIMEDGDSKPTPDQIQI